MATRKRKAAGGAAVRGSRSGRPVMVALDLLGRRWALRILWELRAGDLGFNGLQAACEGISPAVLSQRLRELREHRLVEAGDGGAYRITQSGVELGEILVGLDDWAKRWAE